MAPEPTLRAPLVRPAPDDAAAADTAAAVAAPGGSAPAPRPAPATPRAPGLLRTAWLVARKDLTIELRTRSTLFAALVFTVLGIAIFRFAWDPTAVSPVDLAPGVLWVIFTFAGLLTLHRSFGVEEADRAIDALLAAPVPREGIFLGKFAANLAFVLAVQAVAIPTVALFYDLPVLPVLPALAAVAALAAVGLVSVGTLFSAMSVNTRLTELLLPVLALPFFVPVVMPAAQTTAQLLAGRPMAEAAAWLRLLAGFDLVFVFACAAVFPFTLEE